MARRLRPLLFSTLLALFPVVSSRAQDDDSKRSVALMAKIAIQKLGPGGAATDDAT